MNNSVVASLERTGKGDCGMTLVESRACFFPGVVFRVAACALTKFYYGGRFHNKLAKYDFCSPKSGYYNHPKLDQWNVINYINYKVNSVAFSLGVWKPIICRLTSLA